MGYVTIIDMNEKLIKALKADSRFQSFQEFVLEEIGKLNSLDGLKNMSTTRAGETARARAMAISLLQGILEPFFNFKEKREPTAQEIRDVKSKVGL